MRRLSLALAFLGFALLAGAQAAEATPTCAVNGHLMQWPATNPVWEFCFHTPANSSSGTGNGSGLELRDVFYNNHLVFKRAHAPILNVLYASGCGCFRDWSDAEVKFRVLDPAGNVVNISGTGNVYETNFPAQLVCDVGGGSDIPSSTGFRGVSVERLPDQLVLSTQMSAGWYRYAMRWTFYLDGRIVPWFGFGAVSASCISFDHTHHNYWRLDFDIDGALGDAIQMGPAAGQPVTVDGPFRSLGSETKAALSPSFTWVVRDLTTRRGYRVVPGATNTPDSFAVSDSWAFLYKPSELDDAGQGGGCALNFNNFLNNEPVENRDVVLWIRGGQFHRGGDLDDCGVSKFILEPFGDWNP